MLTIQFLRMANCNLTEKAFPKRIQPVTSGKYDREISLQFLDFRFNKVIHKNRNKATNRKYLEKVVILLWKERKNRQGYCYKSSVFFGSE